MGRKQNGLPFSTPGVPVSGKWGTIHLEEESPLPQRVRGQGHIPALRGSGFQYSLPAPT